MTKKELIKHLKEECPEFDVDCLGCKLGQKRGGFKPHKPAQCIEVLRRDVEKMDRSYKSLKEDVERLRNARRPGGHAANSNALGSYLRRIREGLFASNEDEEVFVRISDSDSIQERIPRNQELTQ